MEIEIIKKEMKNLINTYIPKRQDLIQLVLSWNDINGIPVKYTGKGLGDDTAYPACLYGDGRMLS